MMMGLSEIMAFQSRSVWNRLRVMTIRPTQTVIRPEMSVAITRSGDVDIYGDLPPGNISAPFASMIQPLPFVPSPLDKLVDVNIEKRCLVYELMLGRELGFDIEPGEEHPVVGKVTILIHLSRDLCVLKADILD